jgi:hypothetical protein
MLAEGMYRLKRLVKKELKSGSSQSRETSASADKNSHRAHRGYRGSVISVNSEAFFLITNRYFFAVLQGNGSTISTGFVVTFSPRMPSKIEP